MAIKLALALAISCVLNASGVVTNDPHPITKVIDMLEGLKAKSIIEGKHEAVAYQKFTYWCSTSIDTLKDAIADETEKIAELEDLIAGKSKELKSLEDEIDDLSDQIAKLEASDKEAKDTREKEKALYEEELADVKGTIAAIDAALKTMQSAESATEPAMMLARRQVKKALALISLQSWVTDEQLGSLQGFAGGGVEGGAPAPAPAGPPHPDLLAAGDMEAHIDKYDFKSESVIELLKKLKLKFQDDKLATVKDETNAVNAYELAQLARDDAHKAATESKVKKEKMAADVNTTLTTAENDLTNEEEDKAADSKSLADTEEQCTTKKSEWEERSKTRELEIVAMDEAKKILGKATGVRTEAPENPIPPASPVDFLQITPGNDHSYKRKMTAVLVLREAAQRTHSRSLERLAVEVSSHLTGPFDAVNNMIEKMIFRLMDEQKKEDEHKNWCDEELKKTNVMKTDKEDKIADLNAEIKAQTAAVSELTEDIKAANEMIAEIVAFEKEATEIREIGKKENKEAIKDAEEAQKALENAIAVLETFYKKSGEIPKEPWEFIQEPVKLPENPKTWDSPYTGLTDPTAQPSGIITVLETVMSDFAKVEAETKSQEAVDQEEYEKAMKDNDIEKARRTQEAEMKSNEKERRLEKITSLESSKKSTAGELEKTLQYLKDLEPACVAGDSTYEDRKNARTSEIEALQKSQQILDDAFNSPPEEGGKTFLQIRQNSRFA